LHGEWGGATLMAMEWAKTNAHRGFITSWPQWGGPAGLFFANIAVLVFSTISGDQFLSWGWRVPFWLSIVMVAVGLYIRLGILETPVFQRILDMQQTASARLNFQWLGNVFGHLVKLPLEFFPGVYRDRIIAAVREHVRTAIDVVVHVARDGAGRRHVAGVAGCDQGRGGTLPLDDKAAYALMARGDTRSQGAALSDSFITRLRRLTRRSMVLQVLRVRAASVIDRLPRLGTPPEAPLQSYALRSILLRRALTLVLNATDN
jgi:hypothetical protein